MNDTYKRYAFGALVVVLFMFAFSAWRYAGAYKDSVQLSSGRTFSATGMGKVVATPDIATFTAGVTTEGGKDLVALQKQNSTKLNAVTAFILSKGVAKADIQTDQYSIDPRYSYTSCSPVRMEMMPSPVGCPPATIVG